MTLPSSGNISLSNVQTEFGGSNPISLSEYYRSGSTPYVTDNNTNVSISGTISLNQFYSAEVRPVALVGLTSASYGGGGTTKTISLAGTLTGGIATTPAVGDMIVVCWGVCDAVEQAYTPVSTGYIEVYTLYGASITNRGQSTNFSCYYKFWTSGDAATNNVTINVSGSTNDASAATVYVFRYVNTSNPFQDSASWTGTNNSSVTITTPSVTLTRKGSLIFVAGGFGHNDSSSLTLGTDLSSTVLANGNDYRDFRLGAGLVTNQDISTFNPQDWTMGQSIDRCPVAITLALRAA